MDHLLVNCSLSKQVLLWIFNFKWCGIPPRHFEKVFDFVEFASNWGRCPKEKKIFTSICYGFLWCIWKARNDAIFKKVRITPHLMTYSIDTMVSSFMLYRGNFGNVTCANWICKSFNVL